MSFLKWLRGALGMGVFFGLGLGAIGTAITVLQWLLGGGDLGFEMVEAVVTGFIPIGFMLGFGFSGVLTLVARGRSFAELSLGRFFALSGGVGLALFFALGVYGSRSSWVDDVFNGAFYVLLGGGAAAGALWAARKADQLRPGSDEPDALAEGEAAQLSGTES